MILLESERGIPFVIILERATLHATPCYLGSYSLL